MKRLNYLLGLALILLGFGWASAETVTNYTVDFNTSINTSDHAFKVAPGWGHIVASEQGGWSTSYASYSYNATAGVDGTGTLYCGSQLSSANDYLVTPAITGKMTMQVKLSYGGSIKFYAVTEDEGGNFTAGEEVLLEKAYTTEEGAVWAEMSLDNLQGQRIGIVGKYAYLDNFAVDGTAEIVYQPGLTVTNVVSSVPNSGTLYCDENNNYSFTYTITVQNTGEMDLPADYENLSVSIVKYDETDVDVATTPIGQALAMGESATVEMTVNMNYADYPGRTRYDAKENITGTTKIVTPWIEVKPYVPEISLRNENGYAMEDNNNYAQAFGSFGMVAADLTKTMTVRNTGAAPGNITITVPEGFTADPATFTVPAGGSTNVAVTLSAAEAGIKSGDLVVAVEGQEATYSIALSGTVLDNTKFFEDFESNNTTTAIPSGWYAPTGNWTTTSYTNGTNNYAESGLQAPHKLITPLLRVTDGEKMSFEAYKKANSNSDGIFINVYYSADRENWTLAKALLATDLNYSSSSYYSPAVFTSYVVEGIPAGEYYIAFESGYCAIDNIYGFELVPVEHDVVVKDFNVPTTVTANNDVTAKVTLQNLRAEAETGYVPTLYFDGVEVATAEAVQIPANGAVTVELTFVPNEVGTFPAKAEFVWADEYTVATDEIQVTVKQETAENIVQVGEVTTKDSTVPLSLAYENSESEAVYTAEQLGIEAGSMITSLTYKGYSSASDLSPEVTIWLANADEATLVNQTGSVGLFSTEGMTQVFNGTVTFSAGGSSNNTVDMLVANLAEPFEYTGGALRVIVRALNDEWKSGFYFENDGNVTNQCIYRRTDTQSTFLEGNVYASTNKLPVVYLGVEKQPATYAGVVTDKQGNPLEGVTVTLTSQMPDAVQGAPRRAASAGPAVYTATTDAEGKFTVEVIQNDKLYNANFALEGYKDVNLEGIDFANGNVVLDEPVIMELDAVTGVESMNAGKAVAGVKYYNVAGQASDKAFKGVNIVVTTYTDGTTRTVKVVK